MMKVVLNMFLLVGSLLRYSRCDFACVCNYDEQRDVLGAPDVTANAIGAMYEFDCKPLYRTQGANITGFMAVHFENKIGYVTADSQVQEQLCPGLPSTADLFTSKEPLSTSTQLKTTRHTSTMTTPSMPGTTPSIPSTQPPTTNNPFPDGVNVSGTPLQYIGIGYNLLHGNPDGNPYGPRHLDEGFKLDKRILQQTRSDQGGSLEAHYALNSTSCDPATQTTIIFDERSYQEQLKALVKPSSTHPSILLEKAFTLSTEYNHLYPHDESTRNLYRDITTVCDVGSARYKTEELNNGAFSVTKEFAVAVCQLPQIYDDVSYLKFLEIWGSSIVLSSQLGKRAIQRYNISLLQAFHHVEKLAPELIQHTGAYLGYSGSLSIDTDNYTSTQSTLTDIFSSLHSTIHVGSPNSYAPIVADVVPITYALNPKLWKKIIDSNVLANICPSWFNLSTVSQNIGAALKTYALSMSAPTVHSVPLRIPVTWPTGTYGLLKSVTGCPNGYVNWLEGWRKQDTEDHEASNHYSPDINNYIDGQFSANNVINRFCIKDNATTSVYDRPWPPGQYCLFQYNACPTGFNRGFLLWDDENDDNTNSLGGTLPTGNYDDNTKIYYCCRIDGTVSTPIVLPTKSPFILIRYGTTCQSVYNMSSTDLFVRWDDEDQRNFDARWGTAPYDDGGDRDHRLHFCHYQTAAIQGNVYVPGLIG